MHPRTLVRLSFSSSHLNKGSHDIPLGLSSSSTAMISAMVARTPLVWDNCRCRLTYSGAIGGLLNNDALSSNVVCMDQIQHPLDWWAYGGYNEVRRNTGWSLAKARREVRKTIKALGWNPIGHGGYEELRRRIMDGEILDKDLV